MAWLQKKVYNPFQREYISLLENDFMRLAGSLNPVGCILFSTYRVNKRNQNLEAGRTAVHLNTAGCKVVADELRQVAVVLWL